MEPDDLRAIARFLQQRIELGDGLEIRFAVPSEAEMVAAGLHPSGAHAIRTAAWWDEMVDDVVSTPGLCAADEKPEIVLGWARDVVLEYVRKRAALE